MEINTVNTTVTKRHARVDVADVLRGFAVLAIILLHSIEHFNFYSFPDTEGQSAWLTFADRSIWDGLFFTFGGKAYAIFALLFGFSFFIQHDNQRMRGSDFRLRFCWRLVLLLLIGQLNAAFFTAEVLVMYALVGFVLVATCRLSDRWIITLSAICMLQPVCLWQIMRAISDPEYTITAINTSDFWSATFAAQSSAGFLETVKVNLWEGQLASLAWAWDHGRIFQTAGLFMAGMLIGRRGWFGRESLPLWRRALAVALICFFPLRGLNAMVPEYITRPDILKPMGILLSSLANLSFMVILVSGILQAYYCTTRLSSILARLIPYGRMSMTNYVTQGVIGSALFYHWGLYLRVGITGSLLVGIAIFALQYAICVAWARSHSHGPLEYMWKRATWIEFPFRPTPTPRPA
ncbi:DUF418 domain-containing protein [Muribaculum intestinale]|uniref:DUF418 domain-containing protein n=1 Tax=Muribaculum intestinale TaxID=1796646 RepID=UPI0025A97F28|nr:DUF418 domain-containing protein [Muribaculum intestinale]